MGHYEPKQYDQAYVRLDIYAVCRKKNTNERDKRFSCRYYAFPIKCGGSITIQEHAIPIKGPVVPRIYIIFAFTSMKHGKNTNQWKTNDNNTVPGFQLRLLVKDDTVVARQF